MAWIVIGSRSGSVSAGADQVTLRSPFCSSFLDVRRSNRSRADPGELLASGSTSPARSRRPSRPPNFAGR